MVIQEPTRDAEMCSRARKDKRGLERVAKAREALENRLCAIQGWTGWPGLAELACLSHLCFVQFRVDDPGWANLRFNWGEWRGEPVAGGSDAQLV